jgi:dipeptidyl aminopeptidase/acylaminoacyl peptidase
VAVTVTRTVSLCLGPASASAGSLSRTRLRRAVSFTVVAFSLNVRPADATVPVTLARAAVVLDIQVTSRPLLTGCFAPASATVHVAGGAAPEGVVGAGVLGAGVAVAATGAEKSDIIYFDKSRNVLGPQWSPNSDTIIFGIGVFNAFFNGFHGLFLKPEDRAEGGAQIAIVNADGSGFQQLTSGPANNAFPSFAPDGRRFVLRTFGPEGNGLRIMDLDTRTATWLTHEYDNFPLWSPRGDLIMFSRQAEEAYEIYTVKPDGTALRRLTFTRGNDAHMAWSPDGESIAFVSSRMGFKDEVVYTDAPQPYGELFVMRYDGTHVQQLTDNQWEDGTPAWQPSGVRRESSR